jgi:hypothetical protein
MRVLHRKMELIASWFRNAEKRLLNQQSKKIDRSAEALGVCHHPFHLSLRKSTLQQRRVSNDADKTARNGKYEVGE